MELLSQSQKVLKTFKIDKYLNLTPDPINPYVLMIKQNEFEVIIRTEHIIEKEVLIYYIIYIKKKSLNS